MTELFVCIYRFFRSHRVVCWLSMLLLFLFFGFYAMRIHLEEDIDKLMPSSRNEDGSMKLAFASLKIKDKTFLLFEDLSPATLPREKVVETLMESCDAFVDSLLVRDSVAHTIDDIFYKLPEDLIADGIGYLSDHLPSYIDTGAYAAFDTLLRRDHMLQQMRQNRSDLEGEFGSLFPELIELDPIGMRSVLATQLSPLLSAGSYKTIGNHFFVPDSTVCIAFLTPRFSSTNTGQGSDMFRMLNTEIEHFQKLYPNVRISYHGTPASGFYNSSEIKHDLTTTISGALLLVLVLLLSCFRRWDTIPLLLLPVAFGTLFALSMMYWLKGQFSLLALGIGGVVLGVALSYVLHVLTHREYVSDPEQLLRDQVKPVLLGCITTIGSFAGLLFIKTDLLQDFGLFAAFAILGTTLFSLIYVPQFFHSVSASRFTLHHTLISYPFYRCRPLLVTIAVVVTVGVVAYLWKGTQFDADMHNLGYEAEITEHSEGLLREKTFTGDKQKYFASKGVTMEEAIENFATLDRKLDSLKQLGLVKDYTRTHQIFVSLKEQQRRIDAWHRYWTDTLPQGNNRLDIARQLIAQTAPQAGLRPEAFEAFFDAATASYEPDALYDAALLPPGYQSTMMEESYGGDFLCFTSVRCQNDSVRSSESDYMRICNAVASDPHLLVLDTYYYTTDTLLQMNNDFNVLQWLSMFFVFAVLLVSFRFNWRLALLGFMPILLSWIIVLGAMNIFGVRFNLISIIISTFIFGIGVDYSIFVMNGLTARDPHLLSYHKTAILLSAAILIITVSSMLLAGHPAIRSVGFSTLVGLLSAVILSYVLQPAIYYYIKGKEEKQ